MNDCLFCKIYKEKRGIIYDNIYFFAQFDEFPIAPGHAEIVPKRHIASFFELNGNEWTLLFTVLTNLTDLIEDTNFKELYEKLIQNPINEKSKEFYEKMLNHVGIDKKPDGYNIGVNEGRAAGRTIDHLHIHLIPRYFGDVEDPTGGIRSIIPELANYKNNALDNLTELQ